MIYYSKILKVKEPSKSIFPGSKTSIIYQDDIYDISYDTQDMKSLSKTCKYKFNNFRPLFGNRAIRDKLSFNKLSIRKINSHELPLCNPILQSKVDLHIILGWF